MRFKLTLLFFAALGTMGGACVGDSSQSQGGKDAATDVSIDVTPDVGSDAPFDAPADARACDPSKPFGAPVLVPNVNFGQNIFSGSLSPDELTLYMGTRSGADSGTSFDIYVATRSSMQAAFSMPIPLAGGVNTASVDWEPWISADGLSLYFSTNYHVQVSVRANTQTTFGAGQSPPNVNATTGTFTEASTVTADGERMFVNSDRDGTSWIYEATLGGGGVFGTPVKVAEIASPQGEGDPVISADGLTLYFMSGRAGTADIYVTTRSSRTSPFAAPVAVSELNTTGKEWPVWLSSDDCRLYVDSDTEGTTEFELYVASKPK